MRLYGEANDVPGLATGPIETRFARLRENTAADTLVVWTTPGRWATGEGLSLRFPQLHLEFVCSLADGHLVATKVAQVPEDARPPDREPGAVGVVVRPERIPLPPEDADASEPDPGVDTLERHFAQLAGRRWGGFAAPLRAALEAEAREDEARTERLTVPFKDATLTHGGEEDVWRLKGVSVDALRALDDGEWLEILDEHARSRASARVVDTHPSAGTLIVGDRAASDPPRSGFVRPRSRKKILEQKRALLEELASPTGSLPNLVRLVAAPASMPTPHAIRPLRFVNPAIVRNRSQSRAVALALGLEDGQALLIQGPPGTGKSTTAAEIDVQLILRDPGVRVLVCSHSNHGTDNMLMKVLPFLPDAEERIARIGFYERIAKEARPYYAAADADLGEKNIIFTTIDALVLQDIAGARVYDYVILDEANRAGVLDSLLALARGRRMVLVGDPMQLQPVMSEAEQQMVSAASNNGRNGRRGGRQALVGVALPGAQHVIGKSLFAWIQERRFAPASTVLLDQQNRMHPAIGELVSRVFYSERVRTGPAAPRRGTGLPAFPAPVTWVDTRALRGNVESRAGGTSLFNVAEARLVTSVTRHLASQAPPNLTIGVITAYAEQRDLLRRLMGPHDWPPDRQLEIDTVDAFEGREKDIIVLSLVRANRRRDIGFLRLEQRLNVAVSRSRRLIIIVGDTSTLRAGFFGHLVATAQAVGQIIPAPKLIGQFLQRGGPGPGRRPRRERDERRREGLAPGQAAAQMDEELAAADEFAAAAETGEGLAVAAREGAAGVAREGLAGVAREGVAGQESTAGAGSRRRRRRAWERRRERMRALHEQQQTEQTLAEGADVGALEPARVDEPLVSDEAMPPARLRGRRRRRFGVPSDEEVSAAPMGDSGGAAPPAVPERAAPAALDESQVGAPVPLRRRRLRATAGQEAVVTQEAPAAPSPTAEMPAVERMAPVRPRRVRRTAAAAEVPLTVVEAPPTVVETPHTVVEAPAPAVAPVRRGRRKVEAPPPPPIVEVAPTPVETPAPPQVPLVKRGRRTGTPLAMVEAPPALVEALAPPQIVPVRRGRRKVEAPPVGASPTVVGAPPSSPPAAVKRGLRTAVPPPTVVETAPVPPAAGEVAPKPDEATPRRKRAPRSAASVEQPRANGTAAEPAPRRTRARRAEPEPEPAAANGTVAEPAPRKTRARRTAPASPNGTAAIAPEAAPQVAGAPAAEPTTSGAPAPPRRPRARRAPTGS
jgi:hypothetical protein